ncbi:RES domain-containing protein [Pseudobacillus badius]|uniref:RES domain-containing protein n=1 Tax=Bacillus badius TaxID=1455 RepID=UPI003D3427F0
MNCCVNCFKDPYIIDWISAEGYIGDCNYCKSEQLNVVEISILGEFIRKCLSKAYDNASTDDIPYHVHESMGEIKTLKDVLLWEEEIFSTRIEDTDSVEDLINNLFEASGPSWRDITQGAVDDFEGGDADLILKDSFYTPEHNRYQYSWDEFTYTVKYINRFFDVKENSARKEMLKQFDLFFELMTKELPIGYQIWRGRLDPSAPYETTPQRIKECGPPPRNRATSLRMNPAGISYFYGAEDLETSIKEIRASEGSISIYGLFKTKKVLRIVDLSDIPHVPIGSIFSEKYDHEMHGAKYFLRSFGSEISKPIIQEEAQIEYLPTQILTEYIRAKGFEGVRYSSSLTTGFNITLFCGPSNNAFEEEKWGIEKTQIPIFTDWLELVNFREGKTKKVITFLD